VLQVIAALICIAATLFDDARATGIDFGETRTRFEVLENIKPRERSDFDWRHAMASQPKNSVHRNLKHQGLRSGR